jgi:signal transduction histidine kinase
MKTEIEVGLRSSSLKPADAKALLASNLEEVNKLDTLTAALLRLAKQEQGNGTWRPVPVQQILDEAAKRVRILAKPKKITFDIAATTIKITGDQPQLVELFYVLFENAVKYGTSDTAVEVRTTKQNNTVRVSVRDRGIGIKPAELPHVFERFYRADQSRTKAAASGYGLGLSLARHIAEVHGGDITATSKPGAGSTFTVTLPAVN